MGSYDRMEAGRRTKPTGEMKDYSKAGNGGRSPHGSDWSGK